MRSLIFVSQKHFEVRESCFLYMYLEYLQTGECYIFLRQPTGHQDKVG